MPVSAKVPAIIPTAYPLMPFKVTQPDAPEHSFKLPCAGLWQGALTFLLAHGLLDEMCFPCETIYSKHPERYVGKCYARADICCSRTSPSAFAGS